MSDQITTGFVNEYKMGITLLAQQEGSRLRDKVMRVDQTSEFQYHDQIGPTDAVEVFTRHGDTPQVNTPHDRRQLRLRFFDWADLLDRNDTIQMINNPQGKYVQNAGHAMGRAMDKVIIESFFAAANTGKQGGTSVAFPTSTHQIAAGGTGLTVAKLRAARRILRAGDIPESEPLYIAVTAKLVDDLLGTTEVTSADFNTVKALADGSVKAFMGFEFVHTELLDQYITGGNILCPAWSKNGMLLGVNPELYVDIGPRRDKRLSTQVYVSMNAGATRMDESRVVQILCDDGIP